MNILILGSGGREHAFAWKIAQSQHCDKLYVAPGNAGTSQMATNLDVDISDFEAVKQAVLKYAIRLVVVGPEEPLVKGILDFFGTSEELKEVLIVGTDAQGAKLEGSKDFAKQFMVNYQIPTAQYATFTKNQFQEAVKYIEKHPLPIVLKADGLAAGKGVLICQSRNDAKAALAEMLLNRKFGEASSKVVIEQYLEGIELSVFVLTDGKDYKILPEAKDYKRIGEGDTGLNTGGMGAVSPVSFANEAFLQKVETRIIQPTLKGIKEQNINYQGFIFIGLMNVQGEPYVIEYNVRMGDPETQAVLPRIKTDIVELLAATAQQTLANVTLEITNQVATTVVLVSGGYPENYAKGKEITGLDISHNIDVTVFHAGTKKQEAKTVTNGGRVMALTALANTLEEARINALKVASIIDFEGKYYRKDIGLDVLQD